MCFNGNNMLVTFSLDISINTNPLITRNEIQFNITDPTVYAISLLYQWYTVKTEYDFQYILYIEKRKTHRKAKFENLNS